MTDRQRCIQNGNFFPNFIISFFWKAPYLIAFHCFNRQFYYFFSWKTKFSKKMSKLVHLNAQKKNGKFTEEQIEFWYKKKQSSDRSIQILLKLIQCQAYKLEVSISSWNRNSNFLLIIFFLKQKRNWELAKFAMAERSIFLVDVSIQRCCSKRKF